MISYAQCFEDVILARVFKGQSNGFYIDVGVWHPTNDSVTKHFYDLGWSGVNIEALPAHFEVIRQARPRDLNIHAAVSNQPGKLHFHEVKDTGLSTSRIDYAKQHAEAGYHVSGIDVDTITLREVCAKHAEGKVIDFLKIDVEGAEADVVLSGNWDRYRPKILVIEATVPNSPLESYLDWEPTLLSSDYMFCYFDGLNRWYVRGEDADLRKYFMAPPNPFDEYTLAEIVSLRGEVERLKQEARSQRGSPPGVKSSVAALTKSLLAKIV